MNFVKNFVVSQMDEMSPDPKIKPFDNIMVIQLVLRSHPADFWCTNSALIVVVN